MSPKAFLHELGVKPSRKGKSSARFLKLMEHPDFGVDKADDIMGAERMNMFFADEELAIETLSTNFDRLANSMARVETSSVFKNGKLDRVCELGGGAGILGMWLAKNSKCGFCEVADHAENPLGIGRLWAVKSSIQGINFKHTTYAMLAASGSHDFDFVFAEHGVDLSYLPENPELADAPSEERFFKRYVELADAFSALLRTNGLGLIGGGSITPDSLSLLCKALRECGMVVDWKLSSNERGLLLYVRPQGHILLDSPDDEALAILADALPARKVPPSEARSLEIIFRKGKTFAEICSEGGGVKYRCTLVQSAGLACVFQRSSKGHEIATLFSAARMHIWMKDVLNDAEKRNVTKRFIDERLILLMDKA